MHNIYNKRTSTGIMAANGGHTLIELALVIALLALFGAGTLSLVVSSSTAYKGIVEKKDVDSELRIALSYLDTKIKQNDSENVLRLESSPAGTGSALVIEEVLDGTAYETWIYCSAGRLRETLVEKGEPVLDDLSFELADIESFKAEYDPDGNLLHITVWGSTSKGQQKLDTDIAVRTGIKIGV